MRAGGVGGLLRGSQGLSRGSLLETPSSSTRPGGSGSQRVTWAGASQAGGGGSRVRSPLPLLLQPYLRAAAAAAAAAARPARPRPRRTALARQALRAARTAHGRSSPRSQPTDGGVLSTGQASPLRHAGRLSSPEDGQARAPRGLGWSMSAQWDLGKPQSPRPRFPAQHKGPVHQTYLGR